MEESPQTKRSNILSLAYARQEKKKGQDLSADPLTSKINSLTIELAETKEELKALKNNFFKLLRLLKADKYP